MREFVQFFGNDSKKQEKEGAANGKICSETICFYGDYAVSGCNRDFFLNACRAGTAI